MTLTDCPDCGSAHLGSRCRMNFRDRLNTTSLSNAVTATRTKRSGSKPSEAVAAVFGHDAKDRMMDETQGIGTIKSRGGVDYYKNRNTGEIERADMKHLKTAAGGFLDDL